MSEQVTIESLKAHCEKLIGELQCKCFLVEYWKERSNTARDQANLLQKRLDALEAEVEVLRNAEKSRKLATGYQS